MKRTVGTVLAACVVLALIVFSLCVGAGELTDRQLGTLKILFVSWCISMTLKVKKLRSRGFSCQFPKNVSITP